MGMHRCKRGFGWCKRLLGGLCSLGPKESKRPFAPSPNHFWRLSLCGQFPRSTASQGKTVQISRKSSKFWQCKNLMYSKKGVVYKLHAGWFIKRTRGINCGLSIKFEGSLCGNPTERGESLILNSGHQTVYKSAASKGLQDRKNTIHQVSTLSKIDTFQGGGM